VRRAGQEDFRTRALILGIVQSAPFRERAVATADAGLSARASGAGTP